MYFPPCEILNTLQHARFMFNKSGHVTAQAVDLFNVSCLK